MNCDFFSKPFVVSAVKYSNRESLCVFRFALYSNEYCLAIKMRPVDVACDGTISLSIAFTDGFFARYCSSCSIYISFTLHCFPCAYERYSTVQHSTHDMHDVHSGYTAVQAQVHCSRHVFPIRQRNRVSECFFLFLSHNFPVQHNLRHCH